MNEPEIRAFLLENVDPAYQQFNSRLLPGVEDVWGVRMPVLHRMARRLAKAEGDAYPRSAEGRTHEEVLLQGLVVGYLKTPLVDRLPLIAAHVEKITNWSTCDVFCGALKVMKENLDTAWAFVKPYFARKEPYPLRFAIVMSLSYFSDEPYLFEVLSLLDAVRHEDYYVKMAVAWALSMAYVAHPETVEPYLLSNNLDDWTHNKALQKIIESRQITEATRTKIRSMKRKVRNA